MRNVGQKDSGDCSNKTHCQFVRHSFVCPEKYWGMKPIFNLKALIQFAVYKYFKMEVFLVVKNFLQKNDW